MLELAYPYLLLLAPLPWIVSRLIPAHRERVSAIRVPFFSAITDAAGVHVGQGSVIRKRNIFRQLLLIAGWLLLVFALAKPQWVGEAITRTEAARDVMLAIDVSGSMDYVDFESEESENGAVSKQIRRLDAVRQVVDEFVATREQDRVGLIVFGSKAFLQLPFTRDLETARQMVALMEVGIAGPRTAIGDAIGLSIRSFEDSEIEQRLLILLTDGNDTASTMTPINAAAIATSHQVEIFTIGVGDPEADGEDRVDFSVLEDISTRTGGRFFRADNVSMLTDIYRRIDELVPSEEKTQTWRPRQSLVHWPLSVIVFIGLAVLLTNNLRRR